MWNRGSFQRFIYSFQSKDDREGEGQGEEVRRGRDIEWVSHHQWECFFSLVYSLKGHNRCEQTEARSLELYSGLPYGYPRTWAIVYCKQEAGQKAVQLQLSWYSDMDCQCRQQWLNPLYHNTDLKAGINRTCHTHTQKYPEQNKINNNNKTKGRLWVWLEKVLTITFA